MTQLIKMPVTDRAALTRKHNPRRATRGLCLSNAQMNDIILDLYGLRKCGEDPFDLTFEVVDDKKYLMYILTR